jgi:hypothetical protein
MKSLRLAQIIFLLITLSLGAIAQQKSSYKFSFGPAKALAGYSQVKPEMAYSKEDGYGFDFGTKPTSIDRGGKDALKAGFCMKVTTLLKSPWAT